MDKIYQLPTGTFVTFPAPSNGSRVQRKVKLSERPSWLSRLSSSSVTSILKGGCRVCQSLEISRSRLHGWEIKNGEKHHSVVRAAFVDGLDIEDRTNRTGKDTGRSMVKARVFETPPGMKAKIDPVAVLNGIPPLIAKPLAIFLRDRYRSYKVLKEKIHECDEDLLEFASGYEVFGIRRHPRHGVELFEWAPGASFFSIIGDFNNWAHRANAIEELYLGRDDYDHFRIFVEDQLREGEEEDDIIQEYNYMSNYDKGDEYTDMDAVFQQMNDDYWEAGEDEYMRKSPENMAWEIFSEIMKQGSSGGVEDTEESEGEEEEEDEDEEDSYNEDDGEEGEEREDMEADKGDWMESNDPEAVMKRFGTSSEDLDKVQTEEDVVEELSNGMPNRKERKGSRRNNLNLNIDSARARYEKYKSSAEYNDHGLPPIDIIDNGKKYDELEIVDDPVWREKVRGKESPLAYWKLLVKGRHAWEKKYTPGIPHMGRYRLYLHTPEGPLERIPAYAKYVLPDNEGKYSAVFWDPHPDAMHKWVHKRPKKPDTLRVYECHVGISGEDPRIATFGDFRAKVLPLVAKAGYNAIQLIGVQEHVEYFSVGYKICELEKRMLSFYFLFMDIKVTNMFAVSSRFGTPEDFKLLVDTAHGMGLLVFMDVVHSFGAPNEMVGLAAFDGANDCFFYTGRRGLHKTWGTRMFRYAEYEVIRYLLSNLKWWVKEYQIDGFHFHSVSSMLYTHNGFSNFDHGLQDYCNQYVDKEAQIYLMLANEMLHQLHPDIITIAEDVTMYPGLSQPLSRGGLGFDYHVNMLAAEMWVELIENVPDLEWSMTKIVSVMKSDENVGKALIYAENHNQSIVGGKSLAEMLLNAPRSRYAEDTQGSPSTRSANYGKGKYAKDSVSLTRGISLLKIIKLLTLTLGGCAYLNFMGNEFGHPEWVEFPRSENKFSYSHARRQWSLYDDNGPHSQLAAFDQALMEIEQKHKILSSGVATLCHVHDSTKVIIYTRGKLLFAFNFHPTNFYEVYKVGVPDIGEYEIILNSDQVEFGGKGEMKSSRHSSVAGRLDNFENYLTLEIPPRTGQVYRLSRIWEG